MQTKRRRRVEAVFEAALKRPAAVRQEWLMQVCGADEQLRASVLRLLAAHDRTDGILDAPVPAMPGPAHDADVRHSGRRIGVYRLVREIGRGGTSIVHLAERADQLYRQRVAIKLIRRGLDTPHLVERFCAERQILASLSHPNIARLLDGGTTRDGLPYLVMEHVAGEPITEYCDRRRLAQQEKLRLFITVARTVQYAHRNLIVHRDLKPSNILVTDEGEIRLVDFGIAKLLDARASADPLPQTRAGDLLMTPEYASPEQRRGEAITTATDVYGLGLVLRDLVAENSQRFDRETAHLQPQLRGDLGRIVALALREEPERRYASAEQLAEDVERYLRGRPIRARRDSAAYRAARFASRHRLALAVTCAFLLLLAGYAALLTVKEREVSAALQHASLEAERADQVTTFLMGLFEAADPGARGNDAVTARELLARGTARAEQFADQPAVHAQMLDVMGRTYQHLGQYERAQPLLERALQVRRGQFGDTHAGVAESSYHLAMLQHAQGRLDAAEALLRRALHIQRELRGAEHVQVARTTAGLALVLQDRGDYAGAGRLAREALEARRAVLGREHAEVAQSLHQLGGILRRSGNYAAAEPLYREALALRLRRFGAEHPAVAESLHDLAYLLQLKGDVAAVEPLYQRALTIYRQAFGEEHPAIAATTSNLGLLMFRAGELEAADSLYREALRLRRSTLGPEHPDIALSLGLLAATQRRRGDAAAAEALYRESLAMQQRVLGSEHPDRAHGMNGLALVLRDRGDFQAADSLYQEVLAVRLRRLGEAHPAVASTINDRGVLMREWGRYDVAESLLLQALELRRNVLGEGHLHVERSLQNLVGLYEASDQPEQARRYRERLRR